MKRVSIRIDLARRAASNRALQRKKTVEMNRGMGEKETAAIAISASPAPSSVCASKPPKGSAAASSRCGGLGGRPGRCRTCGRCRMSK